MASELWQNYLESRDKDARDALVEQYLPLVKQMAGRFAIGLPPQVDEDDLIASGVIGLLEALERYNPSYETGFNTFATWRIRGAMLDELRKLNWSPRSLYKRLRQLQEVEQKLGQVLGREPSIQEIAKEMQWSTEAVNQVYAQANSHSLLSLEAMLFSPAASNADTGEDVFSQKSIFLSPEESVENDERREILTAAIETLSERERLLLALYYKEELTLKEIGRVLKVSTARVSQIHARVLSSLRDKLQGAGY